MVRPSREIDHWWRLRSQMSLVGDGDSWQILREGSDQAVLAYATNVAATDLFHTLSRRADL